MANCTIPSNPDVSGIGVRAAIYTQNLVCFLPVIVHLWDSRISWDELKGIKDQSIGMLAVAFAILVTTVILAKGAGGDQTITNYHAAVVLNLSWMNNTSTWIWFILFVHNRGKPDNNENPIPPVWWAWRKVLLEPLKKLLEIDRASDGSVIQRIWRIVPRIWRFLSEQPVLTLGSMHLSLMAAVGIWLWIDPSKFGQDIECATITVVGAPARFSWKPLQIASLMMYSLVLIPGFNLIPPFLFFLTLHISYNWSRRRHQTFWKWCDKALQYTSRSSSAGQDTDGRTTPSSCAPRNTFLIVGLGVLVAFNILFIVDIELTVRRNKGDRTGDAEWGFGQVLSLLLLVIPLRDASGALEEILAKLNAVQKQFDDLIQRECRPTTVVKELQRLIKEGASPDSWAVAESRFDNILEVAVYYGRPELVEFLLNESPVEDRPNGKYGSLLQMASARGHSSIVKILLGTAKYKEDLDTVGGLYGTALCAACANGNIEMVKALLQAGASLKAKGECFGTPLHVAVLMEDVKMAELLLDHNKKDTNCEWEYVGDAAGLAFRLGNNKLDKLLRVHQDADRSPPHSTVQPDAAEYPA
ncbi:hypothetical protein B0H13DRAFT_2660634 [Mycena leptocephala]|nr:hypothetical protein B0H13DRAFT_2660634 [Mycena leptocephala]